ncbi:hypothetical protein [Cohnella massiliensis]|uniref:hypothetical protein n=1 Tax=Cohnella massiliensis TaxID=1816691 RepID=UPI001117D4CF|nr:hypothetical protein [Cohnella massiliensis]
MEKRLTRTDLMLALGFIFLLIVAVGAFFYGVKIGTERTEARFESGGETAAVRQVSANAYQQQDLVSFYHTVFLPYREFITEWTTAKQKWLSDPTADRSASLKELAKSANQKYDAAKVAYIPPVSPLLQDAQVAYLKSLKLFATGFEAKASEANEGPATALLNALASDAYYTQALEQGLSAQENYYESMLRWAATVDPDIDAESELDTMVDLARWQTLPLVRRNLLTAEFLADQRELSDYMPHDLTARIDAFIASGQAGKMKLKSMGAVGELLTQTDAVRDGDFLQLKNRFYGGQLLPQLPFFFPDK